MTGDWYFAEQHARQRHAADLRRAALDRLADEARRQDAGPGGGASYGRLLSRIGGGLITLGARLRAGTTPRRPSTDPAGG